MNAACRTPSRALLTVFAAALAVAPVTVQEQQQQKRPKSLFIMGDDIGGMRPSIYHRGLMVGETPTSIDAQRSAAHGNP